jgi:hypothetical protein
MLIEGLVEGREEENVEKLTQIDRRCRAREVGGPVEGDRGRI